MVSEDSHKSWKEEYKVGPMPDMKVRYSFDGNDAHDDTILFSRQIALLPNQQCRGLVLVN